MTAATVKRLRILPMLIAHDLRMRWSGGILTWAWALVQPLVQIALYAVVFGAVMVQRGAPFPTSGTYVIYLCCGVFCWLGFSETVARSTTVLLERAHVLRSRPLPLALFPLATAGTAWLLSLVGFLATLAMAPLAAVTPDWSWLLLPLPLISLACCAAGAAMLLAPLTVLARDTAQGVNLCLPLLFWATPIVYDPAILPSWAQEVQGFNPLVPAISTIHDLVLHGRIPGVARWAALAAVPAAVCLLGALALHRLDAEVRDAL